MMHVPRRALVRVHARRTWLHHGAVEWDDSASIDVSYMVSLSHLSRSCMGKVHAVCDGCAIVDSQTWVSSSSLIGKTYCGQQLAQACVHGESAGQLQVLFPGRGHMPRHLARAMPAFGQLDRKRDRRSAGSGVHGASFPNRR